MFRLRVLAPYGPQGTTLDVNVVGHLVVTWWSLGGHLVVTWFSKVPLGQKLDKKVVLEEIGSGASFLVRGVGGWKAKVLLSCERECKKTINPEPVLCAPGTSFHTPKLVFVASVPDNWSLVCAFFHCLHSVCMLFACCLHVVCMLRSP